MSNNSDLIAKINELNANVASINQKLEDLPFIKSALLHLITIYNHQNQSIFIPIAPSTSNQPQFSFVSEQPNVKITLENKEHVQMANGTTGSANFGSTFPLVTANVVETHDISLGNENVMQLIDNPQQTSFHGTNNMENGDIDSFFKCTNDSESQKTSNQTSKNDQRMFLTDDEKTLMYNIHTIFGAQRAAHFFGAKPKNVVAAVSKYRTQNGISIKYQMSQREMVRSVKNFGQLILQAPETSKRQVNDEGKIHEKSADFNLNYADCENSDKNNLDTSVDEDGVYPDEPETGAFDSFVINRQLNYPKSWTDNERRHFLANLTSKTFLVDFLREHFDYETYREQKSTSFPPRISRRMAGQRLRRVNFTEEERKAIFEMYEKQGSIKTALFFNAKPRTIRQMAYNHRKRLNGCHGNSLY